MNCFWIVLLSSVLMVYSSPACDHDTMFRTCYTGTGDPNTSTYTDDEFKQQCRIALESFPCAASYVQRCRGIFEKDFVDYYIGANKLFPRICDGDLSKNYLKSARCFSKINIAPKEKFCKDKFPDVDREDDTNDSAFDECVSSIVKDICGKEAYDVFLEVYKVTKLLKPF